MKKIAMIGSTTFPLTPALGAEIVDEMRAYLPDVVFLTRGSEGLDTFIGNAAIVLDAQCLALKGGGGGGNFIRDSQLAAACDELVAFLDPSALDKSNTGTQRVIENALALNRPVRVATVANGGLVWAK